MRSLARKGQGRLNRLGFLQVFSMSKRTQWAAKFVNAPKQNFHYITVAEYIKIEPSKAKDRQRLEALTRKPDELCVDCGHFYIWKAVQVEMPDNDMCFTCITGETDASEDYELCPQ